MEYTRLLTCLADDQARLREVAALDLTAPVPSCPGWTVTSLVRHLAEVYLHKVYVMRHGEFPRDWPPDLAGEEPLALLDRAYGELTAEFGAHDPADRAMTFYRPDQTVGFWIRRMAQETVVHRIDGELATAQPLAPVPDDLAVDGVDEVLTVFLRYGSHRWHEEFAKNLADTSGAAVRVAAGRGGPTGLTFEEAPPTGSWLVTPTPDGVDVVAGGGSSAAATVSGPPEAVLRWLWGRGGDARITVEGDPGAAAELRRLLVIATQ